MKKIKVEIELYKYDELNEKAKEKAYSDHEEFIYSCPPDYENEKGQMVQDDLSKWKADDLKAYIENSIKINKYLFFNDGEIANITHYTGKHKKSGITEFKFKGKIIKI